MNDPWLEFVQASAPNLNSVWQLQNALNKHSFSLLGPEAQNWRRWQVALSYETNAARPAEQILAITKLALDLLVVAHPRITSVGLSYVRWGSKGPTGDMFEIDYSPSSKAFRITYESGAKDRVFHSRKELMVYLERLAERFVFTYVSIYGYSLSNHRRDTMMLYSIPENGGNHQTFEVARRNSAARKIQAAYLKAHYDPAHPIGRRRLLREFEQLRTTLPASAKSNNSKNKTRKTNRTNPTNNKPAKKRSGLGALFRRKLKM